MDEKSQEAVSEFLCTVDGQILLTTYLVTKALAEVMIDEQKDNLPIAIVRPAYISATVKDPFPVST